MQPRRLHSPSGRICRARTRSPRAALRWPTRIQSHTRGGAQWLVGRGEGGRSHRPTDGNAPGGGSISTVGGTAGPVTVANGRSRCVRLPRGRVAPSLKVRERLPPPSPRTLHSPDGPSSDCGHDLVSRRSHWRSSRRGRRRQGGGRRRRGGRRRPGQGHPGQCIIKGRARSPLVLLSSTCGWAIPVSGRPTPCRPAPTADPGSPFPSLTATRLWLAAAPAGVSRRQPLGCV